MTTSTSNVTDLSERDASRDPRRAAMRRHPSASTREALDALERVYAARVVAREVYGEDVGVARG